jgi:hypothetical protein
VEFYNSYRKNLKAFSLKPVLKHCGILVGPAVDGQTPEDITAYNIACVIRLIGPELRLFCKVPQGVRLFHLGYRCFVFLTISQNDIQDGFDVDLIWKILEYLHFGTKEKVAIHFLERFDWMYHVPAIAFVCTAVSPFPHVQVMRPSLSSDVL